jgi:hypothetical protein
MKSLNSKTRVVLFICLTGLVILFTAGCKKDDKAPQKTSPTVVTGPYLYIAGDGYWKISLSAKTPTLIPNSLKNPINGNSITSLITSGKNVYFASQTAGYYKNDVFVPLKNATTIEYLALSDTTVFAAGIDHTGNMAYWQNNSETTLSTVPPIPGVLGDKTIGLSGITLSGVNVYVSGAISFLPEPPPPPAIAAEPSNYAVLWNNGGGVQFYGPGAGQEPDSNPAAIPGYTSVGVAVVGNDVYVAGIIPDYTFAGGYWKNGTFNSINNGAFQPLTILAVGNDLYIPGFTYTGTGSSRSTQGAYWKNGTLISFPAAAGGIRSIAVNGTDVYLLGIDSSNNYVVWKNGSVFETLGSAAEFYAGCMAIGN